MTGTERLDREHQPTAAAAEFRSILFPDGADPPDASEPGCFADLNLDQTVEAIVAGRDAYALKPLFHAPLRDEAAVVYRQDVFRDLEDGEVATALRAFAEEMKRTRNFLTLAQRQHYRPEQQRWLLDAAAVYRGAVAALAAALERLDLASHGLRSLSAYLARTTAAPPFAELGRDVDAVLAGLDEVRYTLRIRGGRVTVADDQGEADASVAVEETFARFRREAPESHLARVPDPGSMDHVEAHIAEHVARLHPRPFQALDRFCVRHRDFADPLVVRFDREAQFYLAYLEHRDRLARTGLRFCYPEIAPGGELEVEAGFDVALAGKLAQQGEAPVTNDVSLVAPERVLVVTGPNQGGKTTFARMVGQLHYLAALGVPVPARRARLSLPDRVFTHFERQEDMTTLRGKLDDELVRMREILEHASAESVVVVNEVFASTTLADAVRLGERVLRRILELGCLGVCVTFVDELASLGEATVSMVATVDPADPSRRTFEVVRRQADGRAYAWAIADKYGLTYDRLRKRLGS